MEYVIALVLYFGGLFLLIHVLGIVFSRLGVAENRQGIISVVSGMIYGFLFAWAAISYLGI